MVHAAGREQAHGELVERWDRERQANLDANRIILTHANDEARELNEAPVVTMRLCQASISCSTRQNPAK